MADTDDEKVLIRYFRNWKMIAVGAGLGLAIVVGAYKVGWFGLEGRMAALETRQVNVEATQKSQDSKLDDIGKKVDTGFDKIRDKIDVGFDKVREKLDTHIERTSPPVVASTQVQQTAPVPAIVEKPVRRKKAPLKKAPQQQGWLQKLFSAQ